MSITKDQRAAITKELSQKFKKASGYTTTEHGIDQWELAMDALVKAIEGIVTAQLQGGPPDAADRREAEETTGREGGEQSRR